MAADDHHSPAGNAKHSKTTTTTGAISPNATKTRKERVPVKPELTEINQYLMCQLCHGYFIDATAIIECHHIFCKSCILKYLETNSYCPICDVQLNNAKPHMSLRSDVIMQRLVYKLVPGSLVSELRRRRDFAMKKCDFKAVEAAELASTGLALEVEAARDVSTILSLEDVVSLSIEYFRSCDGEDGLPKDQLVNQKQEQQPTTNAQEFQDIKTSVKTSACNDDEANDRQRRYLQCPAAVSVGLLKKFLRMKYGLSDDYRVDLLYNGDRDNNVENDLTLLDVAFIWKWNKDEPMHFAYRIFDRSAKSMITRSGTKRSMPPSMMDEPPDDDPASGPQNRSSKTSNSPSTKLAKLSGNSTGANNNLGSTGKSTSRTASSATVASATLAYDFCEEGNPAESDKVKKGKYKGIHRKNSISLNASSSLSKSSSQGLKKSPSSLRSHLSRSQSQSGEAGKALETGNAKRSMSTNTSGSRLGRSTSVGNSGKDIIKSEEGDSDSLEGVCSDGSKNSDSTATNSNRLRSTAQQVIQSQQMNGSLKFSISTALGNSKASDEKREPLKLSLGSLSKSPERKHKHKHHKMKHKEKKALKFTFPSNLNQSNSNQSLHQHPSQSHKSIGKEMKLSVGKAQQNSEFVNRKVGDSKGNGNAPGGSHNTNSQNNSNVPNSVKNSTSAHLSNISKSISVSIGVNVQGNTHNSGNNNNSMSTSSSQNSNKGNQYGNKTISASGLLPKNTGIEIQPTTIPQVLNSQQNSNSHSSMGNNHQSASRSHPLLPDSVHVPKSVTLIPVNPNAMSNLGSVVPGRGNSSGNPPEKSGSGTSNRLNAHTFTHPITNKSLHQITVTEVPPPPKSGRSSPANANNGSGGGSSGSANVGNNSSNAGSGCNAIEKVIANAVANKPQFNGPGSMEITKIYCGTKENPAKKLKERKGLDISISVPGMNVNMKDKCKSTQKLEEALRQKMGIGNSSSTVTMNNKIKGGSQPPATLLNAKMPPGITIGPAAGMNKSSLNTPNNQQNTNSGTTIKGLGFTLPPHITAHPQLPPGGGMRNIPGNQLKSNDKNSNRNSNKESNVPNTMHRNSTPSAPDVMLNGKISNSKSQSQMNQIQSRKQLGEALASMFDMASRNVMKSPSPPKMSQAKDQGQMPSSFNPNQSNRDGSLSSNSDNKRPLDMSSSSSRKNSRESPEPKRPRGNNETSGYKTTSGHETPLDLSGRSSRPGSASSNSSSSSPGIGSGKANSTSPTEKSKPTESYSSTSQIINNNKQRTPTSVPKVSPPTLPNFSGSPNAKQNAESLKKALVSSAAGPQTTTPSILSIAQSLAQKQLQQQQQQNLHNQIMQLHQGLHGMHANQNSGNQGKPGSLGTSLKGLGHNSGNMGLGGGSPSAGMGLSSLSPPIIPMPNPSPPGTGFDPLRNLLTLSDVALRHGKLHPMNNLMAAAGLCPPPPVPHSHAMSMSGSPSPVSTAGLFSHLPQHLLNSLQGAKGSSGILDPGSHAHLFGNLAALSAAHNERLAAAAGMSHHFGGSLSPPLSLSNSFYSGQVRPPSSSPHGSLRIPTVTPKSSSSSNNGKKGSTPPLSFSHPPPHSSPNNSSSKSQASPPVSNPGIFSSSSSSPTTNVTYSSKTSSDSSSTASKNIMVNGSLSNTFPLLPPGIHNPLMPTNRSLPGMHSSSSASTNISKNSIINSSGLMGLNAGTKVTGSNNSKKGIPNSMKISNFLPNKPKAEDGSNVEATITSGSNVGGTSLTKFLNSIPPMVTQAQANLSVSSPPKDSSSRLAHSPTKSSNPNEFMNVFTSSSSTMQSSTSTLGSGSIDSSSKTSLINSIKNEPESSSIPINPSNKSGPTPQIKTILSPTPTSELLHLTASEGSCTKDTVKSNSCEIKSEEGGLTSEACSGRAGIGHSTVGILGLSNLSPPLSTSGRATQPQNRAVRHIPNPSLLFNRQNSNNGSNQIGSLIAPSPTTSPNTSSPVKSSPGEESNSNPFSLQSPIKLDELPLQVPAIPFPGVSVPVQVKVDNDHSLSIPIPVTFPTYPIPIMATDDTKHVPVQPEIAHQHEPKLEHFNATLSSTPETTTNESKNEIPQACKQLTLEKSQESKSNSNLNLISGGIHQIIEKESPEDPDQDIDVGTELNPIFSQEDVGKVDEVMPNEVEEKVPVDAAKVEISTEITTNEAQSLPQETSPNEVHALQNEIKDESNNVQKVESEVLESLKDIIATEEAKSQINTDKTESEIIADEINSDVKMEEVTVLEKEETPKQTSPDEDQDKIDTESGPANVHVSANIDSEKAAECSEGKEVRAVAIEVEDLDVGMDEPMEVNPTNLAVAPEPLDNELEEKAEEEVSPMESCSGENSTETGMEVEDESETVEVVGNIDSITSDETLLSLDTDIPMESSEDIHQDLANLPQEMTENEIQDPSESLSNSGPISGENTSIGEDETNPGNAFELIQNVDMEEVNVQKADDMICTTGISSSPLEEKCEESEEAVEVIEENIQEPVLESQDVVQSQAETENENIISKDSDSNPILNEVAINPLPEAIEVEEETGEKSAAIQEQAGNTNEAAESKESADESINTLEPEAVETSIESSSQLEVICPPVATVEHTGIIPEQNPHDRVSEEIIPEPKKEEIVESEVETQVCSSESKPEAENEKGEDKSQNIIKPEDNEINSILTEEKVQETPTETCLTVSDPDAMSLPIPHHEAGNSSIPQFTEPADPKCSIMDMTASEQEIIEIPEVSMELISATATITTTTSDIISTAAQKNTVEIEVDVSEPSTLSTSISGNSLESQASQKIRPTNNLTLEKVAAGFLASAASSINNNNNTSLTTMATPTCDITITTTNANAC